MANVRLTHTDYNARLLSPRPERTMEHILHALRDFEITPWKLVGFIGTFTFTARWFVQLYATKKQKKVVMPMAFWYLSVMGSVLLLAYFIFGKNDSVGIVSNFFPLFVSLYNVSVHLRHKEREAEAASR